MVWLEAELYKIGDNLMNNDDRGLKFYLKVGAYAEHFLWKYQVST